MEFEKIFSLVGNIPFITEKNARYLHELIIREKISNVLELGIAHGTATCIIAAALQELQRGKVTAVDLIEPADNFSPTAEELVDRCGLDEYVDIVRTKTGYNWFLHDEIVRRTTDNVCEEHYDLCIIDGPKNWTIDGGAFFCVDKLLKKGGRIIFDDYHWTYADSDVRRDATDGITHRKLSEAELETPHIKEVVDLLVMQHPSYGKITMLDGTEWVVAEKVRASKKVVEVTRTVTWKEILYRAAAWFRRWGTRQPQPETGQEPVGGVPASAREKLERLGETVHAASMAAGAGQQAEEGRKRHSA